MVSVEADNPIGAVAETTVSTQAQSPQTDTREAMRAHVARHDARTRALDGLRGIAILLVMWYHQTVFAPAGWASSLAHTLAGYGWCGVDLFFVLSGYLITLGLLKSKGHDHFFRNFYVRRALRILPLYYLVVVISLVILPHVPHPKLGHFGRIAGDELWYWLGFSNIAIAHAGTFRHGILDVCWSLSIEQQFYLLWPVLVFFLSPRGVLRAGLAMVILAPMLRLVWLYGFATEPLAIYVSTPMRLDPLGWGAVLAACTYLKVSLRRSQVQVVLLSGLALIALAAACYSGRDTSLNREVELFGFSGFALLFAALVATALSDAVTGPAGWLRRVLSWSFLVACGQYSYAMYLFHLPLRAVVRDVILKPAQFQGLFGSVLAGQFVFHILATAMTLGAAWLSWHLLEKHCLNLKRFFKT